MSEVRDVVEGDGYAVANVEALGDGTTHVLDEGGFARVDAQTVRKIKNVGEGPALYVIAGGKDGYVGRDGQLPEGETSRFGPVGGAT